MSAIGEHFSDLSQRIIPLVTSVAFPYRMTIQTATTSIGPGGGEKVTYNDTDYTDIPVAFALQGNMTGREPEDPVFVNNRYVLRFPMYFAGVRINIDQNVDRFTIHEQGGEPEKIFRIEVLRHEMAGVYAPICILEREVVPEEEEEEEP